MGGCIIIAAIFFIVFLVENSQIAFIFFLLIIVSVVAMIISVFSESASKNSNSAQERVAVSNYKSLPKLDLPDGYVYVIKDLKYPKFKIGRTVNPTSRIREIQRNEVGELVYVELIRTPDVVAAENYWHRRFAASRIRKDREWFELDEKQLREIRDWGTPHQIPRSSGQFLSSVGALAILVATVVYVGMLAVENSHTSNVSTSRSSSASRSTQKNSVWQPASTRRPLPTRQPTDIPTKLPAATKSPTVTQTATATHTPTATSTPIPTSTALPPSAAPIYYVETANDLNARVRACASTNCKVVGRLRPDTEIHPTAEVEGEIINGSAIWIEFEFQGETAYIHSSLLKID